MPSSSGSASTPAFENYSQVLNSYLAMLQSNPTDASNEPSMMNYLTDSTAAFMSGLGSAECSPLFSDAGDDFGALPPNTPMLQYNDDVTPFTSPLDEFLTTPVFQDSNDPNVFDNDESLFDILPDEVSQAEPKPQLTEEQRMPPPQHPVLDVNTLYSFSPSSPMLDSFSSSPQVPSAQLMKPPRSARLEDLIPFDAPTQPRKYITPSATSRKEVPASFSRKRQRVDEEEELGELPADATDEQMIAFKRRQNTIAARKSRRRKVEYTQALEDEVSQLKVLVEQYKAKSEIYASVLKKHGVVLPQVPP
ncbi:hypothetical protein CYLTODRAFT_376036 [Cylindrobasidium torrendii FP15055 ss-10]|uniref:BZIP domain-containing protein n=1 Tax=Cylindrobasidium torrendii FP15055 ss-10 TaxID=1314674 RepID=A0A0D7BAD2_9AGAR|nr:hypothetical protein CYLTODRAFT_376036 [Cylindrobasidium torrendii FP15055 ss-10]